VPGAAAASRYGATERVLNSLQSGLLGLDWPERARYLTSRTSRTAPAPPWR
jgi:hypothetical protein